MEKFGKRMYGVHVKDFVFDRAGKWEDVVVGTGNLKLKEFMKAAAGGSEISRRGDAGV